jgi:hypothetical protein
MSGQPSLSKSWISTCGDFMPSAFRPAFSVTSSNVGMPSLMPRLMNSLLGTVSRQGME